MVRPVCSAAAWLGGGASGADVMGFARATQAVRAAGWAEAQGRRAEMEDGFVFVDGYGTSQSSAYFAVYDGHGGRNVVDYVSNVLHVNVLEEVRRHNDILVGLPEAFRRTDQEMLQLGINSSGCTVCVCVLLQEGSSRTVYTAALGDSRAVISRQNTAIRMSSMTDHKATDSIEQKRVLEAGGHIINDRVNGILAITRAMGDFLLKMPMLVNDVVSNQPDICSLTLTESDDFVILACDGLWDVMTDQQAVDLVVQSLQDMQHFMPELQAQGRSVAEILAEMLVQEALWKGTEDNVSCVVIFL